MTAALEYKHPDPSEYAPYQKAYLDLVPEVDVLQSLERQLLETASLCEGLPEARGDYAYAAGKWTIKEILAHIADAERVLCYRALRVARGDTAPLAAFDQDAWVRHCACAQRTIRSILDELRAVRQATLSLFRSLEPAALPRQGRTDAGNPFSVRAVPYIIVGHERHHLRTIRERYL